MSEKGKSTSPPPPDVSGLSIGGSAAPARPGPKPASTSPVSEAGPAKPPRPPMPQQQPEEDEEEEEEDDPFSDKNVVETPAIEKSEPRF